MEAGRLVSRDCISRYVITDLYFVVRESGAVVVLWGTAHTGVHTQPLCATP